MWGRGGILSSNLRGRLTYLFLYFSYYDVVRDVRQNKGAILKASVDYMRRLKSDNDNAKKKEIQTEKCVRNLQQENKLLRARLQVNIEISQRKITRKN